MNDFLKRIKNHQKSNLLQINSLDIFPNPWRSFLFQAEKNLSENIFLILKFRELKETWGFSLWSLL